MGKMATEVSPLAPKAENTSVSPHFTEKVIEVLRDQLVDVTGHGTYYKGAITAQQLVEIAKFLPKEELEDLVNNIPPIKDFAELAKREPSTLFLIHVHVGDCVIVEAMLIPWDKKEFAKTLIRELKKRRFNPNMVSPVVELEADGRRTFIAPLIVEIKDDDDEEEWNIGNLASLGDLTFVVPWYDISSEKEVRLTRRDFEALLAKGKVYIRLWWD
jgi:hypothetical protein